jgi:hypothetical protein
MARFFTTRTLATVQHANRKDHNKRLGEGKPLVSEVSLSSEI